MSQEHLRHQTMLQLQRSKQKSPAFSSLSPSLNNNKLRLYATDALPVGAKQKSTFVSPAVSRKSRTNSKQVNTYTSGKQPRPSTYQANLSAIRPGVTIDRLKGDIEQ